MKSIKYSKTILLPILASLLTGLTTVHAAESRLEQAQKRASEVGQQVRDSSLKGADVCLLKVECVEVGAAIEVYHEGFSNPFLNTRYGAHLATVDAQPVGRLKSWAGRDASAIVDKIKRLPNLIDLRVTYKPDYRQEKVNKIENARSWQVEHEVLSPRLTVKEARALFEADLRKIELGKQLCEKAKIEIEMVPTCGELEQIVAADQK